MKSRAYWLSLLILLVGVLACDIASLVSVASPTPTLDIAARVARTETAIAEEKAVVATLTAKAPTRTLVPTDTPTLTPIALPSHTPTPTVIVTRTSAGEVSVFGKEYGIKAFVSKTKKIGGSTNRQSDPGYTYLKVYAQFFKRGTEWKDWNAQVEAFLISVTDAKGKIFKPEQVRAVVYDWNWPPEEIAGWKLGKDWQFYAVMAYFPVPDASTGLKIGYRDIPPIDIEPVPYKPED